MTSSQKSCGNFSEHYNWVRIYPGLVLINKYDKLMMLKFPLGLTIIFASILGAIHILHDTVMGQGGSAFVLQSNRNEGRGGHTLNGTSRSRSYPLIWSYNTQNN